MRAALLHRAQVMKRMCDMAYSEATLRVDQCRRPVPRVGVMLGPLGLSAVFCSLNSIIGTVIPHYSYPYGCL